MTKIEAVLFEARALEILATQNTPIHRLDPRAKLLTTLIFVLVVLSHDKYAVPRLLPFFIFPVIIASLGNIPIGYLAKKLLIVSPFAILIGIANPLLDQTVLFHLGVIPVSGGILSFLSILLRFMLTVSSGLLLIATSGLSEICLAMGQLKVPQIFTIQLLFLYRYIYVLIEEGARLVRARNLRSFNGHGQGLTTAGPLIGQLLLRTLERARRIHLAMLCRGFTGEIRVMRDFRMQTMDWLFLTGWTTLFILLHYLNLPQILGALLTRIFPL
ncbi:MAG: cobalt ECF transporter T component CbiQ [Deltaproteobacteria bacterium RIFOXYD12_FULL_50_9]|nr:MAG: cobalt ECF transporter T component CbiQ [Deltaproteobacteria bacterium RIFOXYD12_FULL_50_9]